MRGFCYNGRNTEMTVNLFWNTSKNIVKLLKRGCEYEWNVCTIPYLYGLDDDNWYVIDKKHDRFILTDKAPEHARESFELYKKINDFDWNDPPVHVE